MAAVDGLIAEARGRVSDFMNSRQDLKGLTREEVTAILERDDPTFRALQRQIRAAARTVPPKGDVGGTGYTKAALSPILKKLGAKPGDTLRETCATARAKLAAEARASDPTLTAVQASAKVLKSAPGSALYALEHSPVSHLEATDAIAEYRARWPDAASDLAARMAEVMR